MKDNSKQSDAYSPGSRKAVWRSVLGGGSVVLAIITVLAAVHLGAAQGNHPANRFAVPVASLTVTQQPDYRVKRGFVGRVEAMRESAVGFESDGLLAEVLVDEGRTVAAGELLARLDTARLEARRDELVAEHKADEAQLTLARVTLKRLENMIEEGAASRQSLDDARKQLRTAQAELELAEARIDSIEVDLDKAHLRAPYDAVITQRHVDEGRVVTAGEPVLALQEVRASEVRVGVAGPLVSDLAVGQGRSLDIRGTRVQAQVRAILPVRGATTRTVDVILTLQDVHHEVRAGDLVTLELEQSVAQAGYWLPLDALAEGMRGLWVVYVLQPREAVAGGDTPVDATHAVVSHLVEILHAESERVYVRGTLPEGTLVIATGMHRVVPGQQVQIAATDWPDSGRGGARHEIN